MMTGGTGMVGTLARGWAVASKVVTGLEVAGNAATAAYGLATGNYEMAAKAGLRLATFAAAHMVSKGIGKGLGKISGRAGRQAKLRALANDPRVSSADRGWIQQELNSIARGQRSSIRVPPGKILAHRRGFEARRGFGYEHSDLQDIDLHKLQHRHEGY
jgi:hypothetical protein